MGARPDPQHRRRPPFRATPFSQGSNVFLLLEQRRPPMGSPPPPSCWSTTALAAVPHLSEPPAAMIPHRCSTPTPPHRGVALQACPTAGRAALPTLACRALPVRVVPVSGEEERTLRREGRNRRAAALGACAVRVRYREFREGNEWRRRASEAIR